MGREHAGALPAAQAGAVRDVRGGRAAGRSGAPHPSLQGLQVHAKKALNPSTLERYPQLKQVPDETSLGFRGLQRAHEALGCPLES